MVKKILSLESLRGIAALIVFSCHFFYIFSNPNRIFSPTFLPFLNGSAAVYIFFILSGYVLSRHFFVSYSSKKLFLAISKRFFRLFPMVIICSFIAYILSLFDCFYNFNNQNFYPQTLTIKEIISESIFVFIDGKHFLNIFWTMRFELVGTLLVFTLIFVAFSRKPPQSQERFVFLSCLLIMLIIGIDTTFSLLGEDGGGGIFHFRSGLKLLTLFLVGACLSTLHPIKINSSIIFNILTSLFFFLFFYYFFKKQTLIQYSQNNSLDYIEYLILGSFIVYGSIHIPFIRKILELPILVKFGEISFAFYALHMIIFGSFGIYILEKFQTINIFSFFFINFILTCVCAYPLSKIDLLIVSKINHFSDLMFKKSAFLPK